MKFFDYSVKVTKDNRYIVTFEVIDCLTHDRVLLQHTLDEEGYNEMLKYLNNTKGV